MSPQNRQLVAILFTDIVGYTAMMQQNEENAIGVMQQYTRILEKTIADHQGQILNDYGDGSLCSFSSVTQAMQCAVEMQRHFQTDLCVPLRIGVHTGEIITEGKKVMGDGVNVASRILAKVSKEDQEKCPFWMSYVYVSTHDYPRALDVLENAYSVHSLGIVALNTDPNLEVLRNEPRFIELLKKINFD